MIYAAHVRNGQIALDEPMRLPEGIRVNVEVLDQGVPISRPPRRTKLQNVEPIELPGGSLAEELINDRR